MTTDTTIVAAAFGSFLALLGTILTLAASKRKTAAETTHIIASAAALATKTVREELEIAVIQRREDRAQHRQMLDEIRTYLLLDSQWHHLVIDQMRGEGIDLPAAPPVPTLLPRDD